MLKEAEVAARALGMRLQIVEARGKADLRGHVCSLAPALILLVNHK